MICPAECGRGYPLPSKERPLVIRKIFLTPYGYFLALHPTYGSGVTDSFGIISSKLKWHDTPDKVTVSWLVYGDTEELKIPSWLETLQNAKEYELENDLPMAIVGCWSGFEAFLDTTLREKFRAETKFNERTIDWLLTTSPRLKLTRWLLMEFSGLDKTEANTFGIIN